MRKKNLLFLLALVVFVLTSCAVETGENRNQENYGYISINLPPIEHTSKRLLNSEAENLTNRYGVYIWNEAGSIVKDDTSNHEDGQLGLIPVPAGTYKMIVAAGYEKTTSSVPYLLGTAYVEDIVVTANATTTVDATLYALQVSASYQTEVYEGDTITVTYNVDFKNNVPLMFYPHLYVLKDGSRYGEYCASGSTTNKTAKMPVTISFPSPLEETTLTVRFINNFCFITDPSVCSDGKYHEFATGSWSWQISDEISEVSDFAALKWNTAVKERPTGLSVNVIWAKD